MGRRPIFNHSELSRVELKKNKSRRDHERAKEQQRSILWALALVTIVTVALSLSSSLSHASEQFDDERMPLLEKRKTFNYEKKGVPLYTEKELKEVPVFNLKKSQKRYTSEEELPPVKILSIDGGGVRGLVPALMLQKLEKETGKSVVEMFDVIAGTSIGGILGLYLNIPDHSGKHAKYTASEAVTMFETKADQIFSRPWYRPITTVGGLWGSKYCHEPLEKLLKEKLGNRTLFSSCLNDTIVTTYELERDKPYFFKSWEAKEKKEYDFPIWQVGRATSAAPTYFPPSVAENLEGDTYSFIDGGVVANNPAMQVYVEIKKRYGDHRKVILVSLGTGDSINSISYQSAKGWGLLGWVQPVIRTTMSGASVLVDDQMSVVTKAEGHHYLRLQPTLRKEENGLDNYSKENLKKLRIRTETTIDHNPDKIEKIVHKILGKDEM